MVNKPINGVHVCHPIFVDLVPCIGMSTYWPTRSNVGESLKSDGCQLVLDQPQKTYPWVPFSNPFCSVSFARAESSIIRNSSAVSKASYMIAKHLSEACAYLKQQRFRTPHCATHVLKTSFLFSIALGARDKRKRRSCWSANYEISNGDKGRNEDRFQMDLQRFSRTLFNCLLFFFRQSSSPTYFQPQQHSRMLVNECLIRGYSSVIHYYLKSFKDETQKYIDKTMSKLLRPPDADSINFNIQDAIHMFQMTHALCVLCLEEGETVPTLRAFDVANSLVENLEAHKLFNNLQLELRQ